MPTTPVYNLPYPDPSDPADVPGDLAALALALEDAVGSFANAIPGEVKLWPGGALPVLADYGRYAWTDGGSYPTATYPKAAGNIATAWRTFGGAADPGASNFRVPDLRGLVPAGLDQMPGGTRANRMTRAVAITIAGRTGEETHVITIPELPPHAHEAADLQKAGFLAGSGTGGNGREMTNYPSTNYLTSPVGSGNPHENVQPTVFVPWIVKLDD